MITKEKLINKFSNLEKIIADGSRGFFMRNRLKIYLLVILYLILNFISGLPYINLVINRQIALFLILLFGLLMFKVHYKTYIILAIASIIIALFYSLLSRGVNAENFGNFAYIFIFISVCCLIRDLMRGKD